MADYEQEMETLDGGSGAKESDTHSKRRIEADDGRAHKLRQQAAVLQETEAPDDDFRAGDTLVSPTQLITGERETEDTRMHNAESSRTEPDDGRAHALRQTVRYTSSEPRDSIRSITDRLDRYRQERPASPLPTIPSVSSDPEIAQQQAGDPTESTDHESETSCSRTSTAQVAEPVPTGKPHISLCQVQ